VAAYVKWESKVRHIPYAWPPSRPWGPTSEDIAGCLAGTHNPSEVSSTEYPTVELLEGYDTDGVDVMSEGDDELLMAIEEMALAEEYSIGETDKDDFTEDEEWLEDIGNGYLPSSPVQVPLKRRRY
jgi:hypothetical protein